MTHSPWYLSEYINYSGVFFHSDCYSVWHDICSAWNLLRDKTCLVNSHSPWIRIALLFQTSLVAQSVKNMSSVKEMGVWSLGWEDPLKKEMATHFFFLPGKSHGQRSLAGYSPWDHKSWTQFSDKTTTTQTTKLHGFKCCPLALFIVIL